MYVASKFMIALLIGVFAFFWLHSGLWYYREWQDRRQGKPHARIDTAGLALDEKRKHFDASTGAGAWPTWSSRSSR